MFDEAEIADLVRCNVNLISFDFLHAQEKSPPTTCLVEWLRNGKAACQEPDTRLASAVWSWREGDAGQLGDAALFNDSDGRWFSRDPNDHHHFACARPREGEPGDWDDKLGENWAVTTATGVWSEGGQACLDEYGGQGYIFAVPVNGWQNERLREANVAGGDVWLDYNDIQIEGVWVRN